jgi:DNA-binding response OmpR family regulator
LADDAPILVVDSDPTTTAFLVDLLIGDGHAVAYALGAPEALEVADRQQPELMLIGDLTHPRETLDVIASVRAGYAGSVDPQLPIIVLTARCGELDVLRAFEVGADDVVCRPFSYSLLRARMHALTRRTSRRSAPPRLLEVGALRIDTMTRRVTIDGKPVLLCRREYELLVHLAAAPERVFKKEDLLRDVWGFRSDGTTRTLDTHACRLRRKLPGDSRWIVNVWGVGYRLIDPPIAATA